MTEYTASAYIKQDDYYTKPQPHPKWWRRLLGQTVSHPIGFTRIQYAFKAPENAVNQQWMQDLLLNSLMSIQQPVAGTQMVETKEKPSPYIKTTANGFVEKQMQTNLLRNNLNDKP